MKINYRKVNQAIRYNERLPRKIKKATLGLKMSRKKIKQYYNGAILFYHGTTEITELSVNLICPKCGCSWMNFIDHQVEYPEIWMTQYCARCHFKLTEADNSPVILFFELDAGHQFIYEFNMKEISMVAREQYNDKHFKIHFKENYTFDIFNLE